MTEHDRRDPATATRELNEAPLAPSASQPAAGIRRILLAVLFLGIGGSVTELLLLSHHEDRTQLIPFASYGVVLAAILWLLIRRTPLAVRAVQVAMALLLLVGLLGVVLHFRANAEFQTDIDPSISGGELFWKSIRATAPPALAPGVMVQLALVGFAYTYRHPALRKPGIA